MINTVKDIADAQNTFQKANTICMQVAADHEAYKFQAGEDPFVKIKSVISDKISKLEEDAASNATEKAYCDDELTKTDAKQAELEDDVESLTSEIDRTAASSAMKVEVLELQEELVVNWSQAFFSTPRFQSRC